jgi:hypothetical protein
VRFRYASLLALLAVACGGTESATPLPDRDAATADQPSAPDAGFVIDIPKVPDDVPTAPTDVPAPPTDVPAPPADVPAPPADVPAPTDVPAPPTDVPAPPADVPTLPTDAGAPPGDGGSLCPLTPACDAPPPAPSPTTSWRHLTTQVTVRLGSPRHRGRDMFYRVGDPQWAMAKFAYGLNDDDLNDEDVEVFLLRGCTTWERLGTARTSRDSTPHPTTDGVEDTGGRVFFRIPADRALGVGWHRLRFVVRGDHSVAEQWIRVVPEGARFVVTDLDGTMTSEENAQFVSLLTGNPPAANPGGALVMRTLMERGYEVLYLTARPEWLVQTTHTWLANNQFPRSIVHTTLGLTGALGNAAVAFKTAELNAIRTRFGSAPEIGIGNTDSDAAAYNNTGVRRRYLYRYMGDLMGGTLVNDYNALAATMQSTLAPVCR